MTTSALFFGAFDWIPEDSHRDWRELEWYAVDFMRQWLSPVNPDTGSAELLRLLRFRIQEWRHSGNVPAVGTTRVKVRVPCLGSVEAPTAVEQKSLISSEQWRTVKEFLEVDPRMLMVFLHDNNRAALDRVLGVVGLVDETEGQEIGSADPVPDDLINQRTAAELIGCSERTIQRRLRTGDIEGHGAGRKISRKELMAKSDSMLKRRPRRHQKSRDARRRKCDTTTPKTT